MANNLAILETQLAPLAPRFTEALAGMMPVERLTRTIVVSCERLPKLLECDRQSLFNAAMSAACLGLEVDGVTGQAYLIPFKGKAQLVIGYKGMNTLAARSGITIAGAVVRDGDEFEYELGSKPFVRHVPKLGNKGRIIGAWATATANARPPVVNVMGIDDLMAVKAKSPGASFRDSPWNDPNIGFPAMCEKTVKRRLSRSLPLNVMQLAARLDEAVDEQGKPAHITADRNIIIDGEFAEASPTPTADDLTTPAVQPSTSGDAEAAAPSDQTAPPVQGQGGAAVISAEAYVEKWRAIKNRATDAAELSKAWNDDKATRAHIAWENALQRTDLQNEIKAAVEFMKK